MTSGTIRLFIVAGEESGDRLAADLVAEMKRRFAHVEVAGIGGDGLKALGLDPLERRYLTLIAEHFGGGPVGVETIAASLAEARDAVEDVVEPFLLQCGLIQRTPRGRVLSASAFRHLGLEAPKDAGADLFGK